MDTKLSKMNGVRVNRNGDVSDVTLGEESAFYTLCGFRSADGFGVQHEWTVNGTRVRLFAKTTGKANSENKFEFPPPIAETLFFGKCLLVGDESLTASQWNKMYEELMGGFESLEEEEESEDEEEGEYTKEGYRKDSFVVSDSEAELEFEDYSLAKLKI